LSFDACAAGLPCTAFREPDLAGQVTAVALLPDHELRKRLARLHLLFGERR
jgi:hypothetical protein